MCAKLGTFTVCARRWVSTSDVVSTSGHLTEKTNERENRKKKLTLKQNLHLVDGPPPIDSDSVVDCVAPNVRSLARMYCTVHFLYQCQDPGLEIALGFPAQSLRRLWRYADTVSATGITWWLRKVSVVSVAVRGLWEMPRPVKLFSGEDKQSAFTKEEEGKRERGVID